MDKLIFQTMPVVNLATNTFIGVQNVLKFEDTPLIEIVKDVEVGFTTQIPIYHQDGTYIAKAVGNRIFKTEEGKLADVKIEKYKGVWECSMEGKTLFEIHHQQGDAFRTTAELFAPEGYLVKCSENPKPELIDMNGDRLQIGGVTMIGNIIQGFKTGIWIDREGVLIIGSNK